MNKKDNFINKIKEDYHFQTFISSFLSTIAVLFLILYNGFLGIRYSAIWNGTICVYYIFLAIVRGYVLNSHKKVESNTVVDCDDYTRKVYIRTHIVMMCFNLILIYPIAFMIKGQRSYNFGLIPAIALATLTFVRITTAIIHIFKSRKQNNAFIKELRLINFVDSLVSILILQNTLIMVVAGEITSDMKILSIVSSSAIWIMIATVIILSMKKKEALATTLR